MFQDWEITNVYNSMKHAIYGKLSDYMLLNNKWDSKFRTCISQFKNNLLRRLYFLLTGQTC